MKYSTRIAIAFTAALAFLMSAGVALAAPTFTIERTILPEVHNTYDLGTTTRQWNNIFAKTFCFSGDCRSAWPAVVAPGLATSSPWIAGQLAQVVDNGHVKSIATSSLGLLTTDVAEGSNLYFTNARADARINATSTIGTLTSAPNLGTVKTSLTGILKATAGVLSTAVSGTDYAPATSGSSLLYGNGSGGFSNATVSSPLTFTGGTLGIQVANTGQNGYLSSTDWNTFNGKESVLTFVYPLVRSTNTISSALSTTTSNTWGGVQTFTNAPIFSSLTGLLKGNGSSALTVASNGTDYTLITANTCSAGQHVSAITAAGIITCSADSGSGGGTYPFTPLTTYGVTAQATTSPLWLQGSPYSLFASSTSVLSDTGINVVPAFANLEVQASTSSANPLAVWGSSGTSQPRLLVLSNGNVGIATTAPATALDVVGQIRQTLNGVLVSDTLTENGTFHGFEVRNSGLQQAGILVNTTGEVRTGAFRNSYFPTFYSNGSEAARISTGGNLGIGTTTPQRRLWSTNTGTNSQLVLEDSAASANAHYFGFTNSRGSLDISAMTDNLATSSRLFIGSGGKVGIGTQMGTAGTNDYGTFNVNGRVTLENEFLVGRAAGDFAHYFDFNLRESGQAGNFSTGLLGQGEWYTQSSGGDIGGLVIGNLQAVPLVLGTGAKPRVWITGTGLVGVGTTSPLASLDVAGINDGTAPLFQLSSVASFATTTRFIVLNSGNVGVGSTSPGTLFSIGANTTGTNFVDNATTTKSGVGGYNIATGCYAIAGVCISGSGGGGISSLNGLTGATQTFATTSSNGGWGFSSTGTTHTLNIPTASATNPLGLLSSTDWSTFNGKQSALTFTYPLVNTANTVSLAFGTTTANSWSQLQTLTAGAVFGGVASPAYAQGKLVYDTDNQSLTFFNNDSSISLQVGQEEWTKVMNNTGSTIANGAAVYINGASGVLPTVALSDASDSGKVPAIGLMTESCTTGSTCYVTTIGVVHGVDTSAFAAGAIVYVAAGTPGGLTTTSPTSPNYRYRVGIVTVSSATVGAIHVTPSTAAVGNGTAGQFLGINGSGRQAFLGVSSPLVSTGTGISLGTVGVANGGTGQTTFTSGQLLYGNGTNALSSVATSSASLGLGLSGLLTTIGSGQTLSIATSSLYSGTVGQFPYFSGTNTITATSSLFLATSGNIGIGTTTPGSILSIQGVANFVANAVSTIYNGLKILGTLTLPSLATPAGSFLAVDASGNVIATSTPSSGSVASSTVQTFTASGTYTRTSSNVKWVEVEVLGPGGDSANNTNGFSLTGGGAGEWAKGVFTGAQVASPITVTVGTNAAGTATSFGGLITANAGSAGGSFNGGTGGTGGTGGYARNKGMTGHTAMYLANVQCVSGGGGDSLYGIGGLPVNNNSTAAGVAGTSATGFGAGGGSGCSAVDGSPLSGTASDGTDGYVIVREFY